MILSTPSGYGFMVSADALRGRGILFRLLLAITIVFATFNPWSASFYHWALAPLFGAGGGIGTLGPLKVLAGLVLIVGWVICVQATKRSLGLKGALLVVAIFGTLIWLLVDQGLLSPTGSRSIATIILILVSAVLAIGMSWSHLNRRLTGQIDTDQVA
jgi:hypothetical protein